MHGPYLHPQKDQIRCLMSQCARRVAIRTFACLSLSFRDPSPLRGSTLGELRAPAPSFRLPRRRVVRGDTRDRSPAANKAFEGQVPKELMDYLQQHKDTPIPELRQVWESAGFKASGTWEECSARAGRRRRSSWPGALRATSAG